MTQIYTVVYKKNGKIKTSALAYHDKDRCEEHAQNLVLCSNTVEWAEVHEMELSETH